MRRIIVVLFCMLASQPAIAAEDAIMGRMASIQRSLLQLQEQVTALEKKNDGGINSRSKTMILNQIDEVTTEIRDIRNIVDQLQFDMNKMQEKLIKFISDVDIKLSDIEKIAKDDTVTDHILNDITDQLDNDRMLSYGSDSAALQERSFVGNLQDKNEIKLSYQEAYSFLKSRDYTRAKKSFNKFLEAYPSTKYRGSAHFWLGEIYFMERDFEKASIEYLKGYQSDIRGSRAQDNLLKLGKSLAQLKRVDGACTTLDKLRREFPNASHGIKVQTKDEMKKLACPQIK